MYTEQHRWVLTDLGAMNFLKDQVTLRQAVTVINQLMAENNAMRARLTQVESKLLALPPTTETH